MRDPGEKLRSNIWVSPFSHWGKVAVAERRLNMWVAVAEIISAAAVVISLVYVGLEIRRSTLDSEADIQAELLSHTTQRRYLIIESGGLVLVAGERICRS